MTNIDIYIMDTELWKSRMITRVAMMAIEGATDIDQPIGILVNVLVTIHNECKSFDPSTKLEQLKYSQCTIVALMHLFLERYGIGNLIEVIGKSIEILGEPLVLDTTILNALNAAGANITNVEDIRYD